MRYLAATSILILLLLLLALLSTLVPMVTEAILRVMP